MPRPSSLAAAALGMLSLAQLSSAFLQAAPRHAARAALLAQARGGAGASSSRPQPLGRAGFTRMMATVAPAAASVKKLSNPQEELLKDVRVCLELGAAVQQMVVSLIGPPFKTHYA